LTDQGVIARKDLDGEGPKAAGPIPAMQTQPQGAVFDFVLKKGFFKQRPPVRGKGALLKMQKIKADAAPAAINIGNWRDGGDAFAQSFSPLIVKLLEAMQAKAPAPTLPPPAAASTPTGKGNAKAELRSWMQDALDNAIRQYQADRATSYADLSLAVKKNAAGAKKKAKEIYGRNAIARALGVRSAAMVSKSPAWVAIAEDLGLTLNRGRRTGTRHTQRPGRVGHEIAVENKSAAPQEGADNAPAEQQLETAERQETIRRINAMARAGRTAKEKADNQKAADALIQKLQRDECTDDEARQVVDMVLNREE
jgi:hypothetical protein